MITDTFEVTENHIKLLKRMCVNYNDFCEFGAPEIDPKSPYGNSSVYYDIGEILGINPETGDEEDPEFTEEQEARMLKVHKETAKALDILVQHFELKEGKYEQHMYGKWVRL